MEVVHFIVERLPLLRLQRGVSLREIADSTKIPMLYLEAIEAGEFDKVPGGVYLRSYVRQYARAIDLDEDELLQALPSEEPQDEESAPAREPSLLRRLVRFAIPAFTGEPAESKRG